jgi:hypothetical protein
VPTISFAVGASKKLVFCAKLGRRMIGRSGVEKPRQMLRGWDFREAITSKANVIRFLVDRFPLYRLKLRQFGIDAKA